MADSLYGAVIASALGLGFLADPAQLSSHLRAEAARNQSGAGLGLWLSQALAHALGSEVVMQNNGDKISFSLTLPYA
jgi:signal transduction histidine kinase